MHIVYMYMYMAISCTHTNRSMVVHRELKNTMYMHTCTEHMNTNIGSI